jgi:hypothetical protein
MFFSVKTDYTSNALVQDVVQDVADIDDPNDVISGTTVKNTFNVLNAEMLSMIAALQTQVNDQAVLILELQTKLDYLTTVP